MSALKRLLSLALSLLMLGLGGGALGETPSVVNYSDFLDSMTPQQAYDEYVDLLNLYLNNDPESAVDIEKLYFAFARVDYAYSFEFSLYTKVLYHLEQEDFTEATNWLIVLQINSDEFEKHLASEDFRLRYFNILGTETLSTYIEARREEAAHNASAAAILYERCLKFFDSMDRYTNNRVNPDVLVSLVQQQIADGDYAKAVENAQRLLDMGHHKAQALYAVASSKLQEATAATTAPTVFVPVGSSDNEVAPTPTLTPAPTPTPYTKSWGPWTDSTDFVKADDSTDVKVVTQYRSMPIYANQDYVWSDWSAWSATATSGSSTREVQKEYRYRDTTYQPGYSDWSTWSDWSTNATSNTDLKEVETKTEEKVSYTYTYKHWHYKHSENGWQNSYAEYKGSKYVAGSGKWEYKTTTSPLPQDGTKDGHARYRSGGVSWYYQTKNENVETITYYRYRTRTTQQEPVIGAWSSWSSAAATASSTREVEIRYRFRTLEPETTYSYGKWSAWSDVPIAQNSERKVETRKIYRYRKLQ